MPPIFAELTLEGVGAGVVGMLIVAILLGLWLLQKFQDGRKALSQEIIRELRAGEEPQAIEVQSPLSVKPHVEYTPISDHLRLAQDFRTHCDNVDRRFMENAQASSASRQKIYDLIREQNTQLNARIDAIPERVIELLATTQRLHTK